MYLKCGQETCAKCAHLHSFRQMQKHLERMGENLSWFLKTENLGPYL